MQNRTDNQPTQVASSEKTQGKKIDPREPGRRNPHEGEKRESSGEKPESEAEGEANKAEPSEQVGRKLDIRI